MFATWEYKRLPRSIAVCRGDEPSPFVSQWTLAGVISNIRYVERPEQQELTSKQAPLYRSKATLAALIPIRKTAAWWNLTQEERRNIFETKSYHIAEGVRYLPSVARQLYHSRDIGEPFDFHQRPQGNPSRAIDGRVENPANQAARFGKGNNNHGG